MIIDSLHNWDQHFTLAINQFHSEWWDAFWQFMSDVQVWFPLYAIVIVMLFVHLGWKKALVVTLSFALTIAVTDQIANLIKDSVTRLRPCYDYNMLSGGLHILEKRSGYFGFFSGHSANAFGFAAVSLIGLRNDRHQRFIGYGVMIYVWATLIALSRVFVGKHYFGDILVGALIGSAIGVIFALAARYFVKKIQPGPVR
jgi:undecaprenyl-diphosphatase